MLQQFINGVDIGVDQLRTLYRDLGRIWVDQPSCFSLSAPPSPDLLFSYTQDWLSCTQATNVSSTGLPRQEAGSAPLRASIQVLQQVRGGSSPALPQVVVRMGHISLFLSNADLVRIFICLLEQEWIRLLLIIWKFSSWVKSSAIIFYLLITQ